MRLRSLSLLLVLASLIGCGRISNKPPIPLYPVTGTITYNGKPVVGADVVFRSEEQDRSSFGRTNDRGQYTMTTFSSNDGACEGKQIVTIIKFSAAQAPPVASIDSPDYVPPGYEKAPPPTAAPVKDAIPEKYSKPETSGLAAVVSKDGPNVLNFELTD